MEGWRDGGKEERRKGGKGDEWDRRYILLFYSFTLLLFYSSTLLLLYSLLISLSISATSTGVPANRSIGLLPTTTSVSMRTPMPSSAM